MNWDTLAARIALARALLVATRETKAAARNQRHIAVIRRALDRLMRSGAKPMLRANDRGTPVHKQKG